jgi:hypothetical protein
VLLGLTFTETDAPEGYLELAFAGGGTMRLTVEGPDVILADIGDPRATRSTPDHSDA